MATFKSTRKTTKPKTSVGGPKKFTGAWQDMAGLPSVKGPGGGQSMPPVKGGGMRGVVPTAYKAEHQAEWDAANHKERMAMRKAAPHVKPATSVKRTRKPKPGGTSIKPPKATGKY